MIIDIVLVSLVCVFWLSLLRYILGFITLYWLYMAVLEILSKSMTACKIGKCICPDEKLPA